MSRFPITRMRRLRSNEGLRRMVRETRLSPDNLIYPLFLTKGEGIRHEIGAMPGQYHLSPDEAVKSCAEIVELGIPAVLLFGLPSHKDDVGSEAWDANGSVQQGVSAIKSAYPELQVITDVCFCAYTNHGHCGVVHGHGVDNDATLRHIGDVAVSHVAAGADMVAPSDMMDGRVGAIRTSLDQAGHVEVPIMSYAAKYSSAFYGPFREAADSTPQFGDRRAYQMDPANSDEAIREVALDIEEGADIVMVKPALAYLDIIYRIKTEFGLPTAAYHVSGEYSMIKAAAERGWVDEAKVMHESLLSIRRAGADLIITYAAKEIARMLQSKHA